MKILVWGTGIYAAHFLDKYEFLPCVDGFVSGKEPPEAFRNQYMQGKTWHNSSELADLSFDILLIAVFNQKYINEMLLECERAGVPGEKIVVLLDLEKPFRPEKLSPAQTVVLNHIKKKYVPFTSSSFTEEWRRYYYLHEAEIPLKIQRIAGGLDEESMETVRLMIERKCKMQPLNKYSKYFLANISNLLTQSERSFSMESSEWEGKVRTEYGLSPDLPPLEFSVFHFDCGLSFLPQAARDLICGRAVIDGGAYWGDSALVLEKYQPSSIHCFEPMPPTLQKLAQTVLEKGLTNVVPVNMGLGDQDGQTLDCFYNAQFMESMGMDYVASIYLHDQPRLDDQFKSVKVKLTTIDAYAQKNRLDVGLIKLDVEGAELSVIRSALKIIRSLKPVLLISVYHTPQDLFEIKPLIESLGLNYRFMIRHLDVALDNEYMLIGYPA
jgi:FkbM family methyltransferase